MCYLNCSYDHIMISLLDKLLHMLLFVFVIMYMLINSHLEVDIDFYRN